MSPESRAAIISMNLAVLSFSIMYAASKWLSPHMSIVEISFYRSLLAFLPMLFLGIHQHPKNLFRVQQPKLMVTRCIIGTLGLVMTFYSYKLLPLPVATTILFTASFWTILLSRFVLSEKTTRLQMIAIIIGFCGILVMLDPNEQGNLLGIIVAVITAMIHASVAITLRKLGHTENPITVSLLFLGGSTLITAFALPFVDITASVSDIPTLVILGLAGASGQFFITRAYQKAKPSSLASFNYLNLVWTSLFGYFIWGDILGLNGWVGAALIIGSNLFIVIKEQRANKKAD